MKIIQPILWIVLSFSMTMFVAGKEKPVRELSVVLDWTPNTNHTGIYVAKNRGYFAKEKLKVKILQPSDAGGEALVSVGKAEFAISFQEYVTLSLDKGLGIVSIAAVIQNNTAGFASLKKKNILRPIDFAGKTYCGYGANVEKEIVLQLFKLDREKALKEGVKVKGSAKDIRIVTSYDGLFSGSKDCDFFWIFAGWGGVRAKMNNVPINNIMMRDYADAFNYYTPVIITNRAMVTKNKLLAKKFMNAVKKGYEFAIKNPEAAAKILEKDVPELDPKFITASQKYLSKIYAEGVKTWGIQNRKTWENFNKFAFEHKLIGKKINVDRAFTNEFVE